MAVVWARQEAVWAAAERAEERDAAVAMAAWRVAAAMAEAARAEVLLAAAATVVLTVGVGSGRPDRATRRKNGPRQGR